jgi:hypothetical protein
MTFETLLSLLTVNTQRVKKYYDENPSICAVELEAMEVMIEAMDEIMEEKMERMNED